MAFDSRRYTECVPALTFNEARATVLRELTREAALPPLETVALELAAGRILAQDAPADRDFPPFHRSMRDGFAVRAADLPGTLRLTTEIRAGQRSEAALNAGEAIEIMTGAPVPPGADAVVMVEHCMREGDWVRIGGAVEQGANIAPRGSEAREGDAPLVRGSRLDYPGIAWLAANGLGSVPVFARPRVAIVSTGDEIVEIAETPEPHQIRNSNLWSIASQVTRAGGAAVRCPIARDTKEHTRVVIEQSLDCDMLLLSGGVSAGKYDVVESVLADLGAEFFFDRVLIQPGAPLVFGRVRGRFFFGLPGNPVSGMVTFEIFARAALQILSGATETPLPFTLARLASAFRHKPGLTRFLPARIDQCEVAPLKWSGSGDIASLCRANAYLVAEPDHPDYAPGDLIQVLPL